MTRREAPVAAAVPFVDLEAIHAPLKDALLDDIASLIDSAAFVNGPHVAAFEAAFAAYCHVPHCVGVASGLDALRLALIAAGIEPGDEVIVPAMTFAATLEAVLQAGGRPVLVDIAESDYNIDPRAVEAAITWRARFVIPVHLYGQMADMAAVRAIAARHGLAVIEDACQAQGAVRDGIRVGTSGFAAAFSFYPAKNLGAMGDAGACVTGDAQLAASLRVLREHGQREKYEHTAIGYTARLDTIQALVLLHKLPLLEEWNARRRVAAEFYSEALAGVGDLRLPRVPDDSRPVWHLYVVRTEDPDALADFLRERGVATGRHYPRPPHLMPAYASLGDRRGSFPVAEQLADECLSLPIHPGSSEAQLVTCVEAVRDFFTSG